MSKYLISVQEIYRADSETEATALIADAKNSSEFVLAKYNCEHKERKAKGELIDEWYKVTLNKHFTDEKEPDRQVEIFYEEQA
jgi:hypothetical protein